jgi:chaperone required for assembly of F1-ATPase
VSAAAGRAVDKSEVFRQLIRYADADTTIGRDLGVRIRT